MRERAPNVTMNSVALYYDNSLISNPDNWFSEFNYFTNSGAFNLFCIKTPHELKLQIAIIQEQALKADIGVALIFEFHGSTKGLHIGDEILHWDELAIVLCQLNLACRNQVYSLFATCFASQLGIEFQDPPKMFIVGEVRAPINFAVFPEEEFYEWEVEEFVHPFIKRWLSGDKSNMDDLFTKIFATRGDRNVCWINCYGQWDTLRQKTYKMLNQKVLGNWAILNQHLRSQKINIQKRIGRCPRAKDYREHKSQILKIEYYKLLLSQIFDQFFMIDVYPENATKYIPDQDYSDIEFLILLHNNQS